MEKNKIGIALAGGGLQGFAHIGALKALEELNVDIEYVSGTSTGSIVASLYAMGFSLDEIRKVCEDNYKNILKVKKRTLLKMGFNYLIHKETKVEGIIDGKVIEDMINNEASKKGVKFVTEVNKRLLAMTTVDTKTMKQCIFPSKQIEGELNIDYIYDIDIGKAVRASMAFPGIFTTVNFKDYNFIDGGTVNNLPTKVLKDLGANKIISISFDLTHYTPSNSLEGVLVRALDIFSYENVTKGKSMSDISIEISNPSTSLITMDSFDATLENGYRAVMEHKDEILKFFANRDGEFWQY